MLNRIFLIGIFCGIALVSCRDSAEAGRGFELDEQVDYERVKVGGEDESNVVISEIRNYENLSTFSENLEKIQFQQNRVRTEGPGTLTGVEGVSGVDVSAGEGSSNMSVDSTLENQNTGQNNYNQTQTAGQGYTIFAPSNDAFDVLTEDQESAILYSFNREANLAFINYLMVDQKLPQDQLKEQIRNSNGTYSLKTMQGENITATLNGEIIVLKDAKGNEARVVEINDRAQDGILYIIDGVLMPGDLTRNEASGNDVEVID